MTEEDVVTRYFEALEAGVAEDVLALFTDDAVVRSPVYGRMPAAKFYPRLLSDTASSRVSVTERFVSPTGGFAAAHFTYRWELRDGSTHEIEGVDVFELAGDGRIRSLTIVYDAETVREAVEEL